MNMSIMQTDGVAYAQTIVNQSCSESLEANEGTTSVQCTLLYSKQLGLSVLKSC